MRGEWVVVTSLGLPTGDIDAGGYEVLGPDTTRTVSRIAVAPRGSDESAQSFGQKVVSGYSLYLPPGVVLLSTDRLEIRGVPGWQVEGDGAAGQWSSPFSGRAAGIEVAVKRAS